MKIRVRWIFIAVLFTLLATPIIFVQSRFFAQWLTKFAKANILKDVGIEGGFGELSVQVFPPGILVKEPKVVMLDNNPMGLPIGTRLESEHIEITFDLLQLVTGIVAINGVVIHGADLHVQFTKEFYDNLEKRQAEQKRKFFQRKKSDELNFNEILAFKFKSIGFTESKLDLSFNSTGQSKDTIRVTTYAKELTIGKGFVEAGQSIDLGLDLAESTFEGLGANVRLTQAHASFGLTDAAIEIRNFAIQDEERNLHIDGTVNGNVFKPKSLLANVNYFLRGPISSWIGDPQISKLLGAKKQIHADGMIKLSGHLNADLLNLKNTIDASTVVSLEKAQIEGYQVESFELESEYKSGTAKVSQLSVVYPDQGKITLQPAEFDLKAVLNNENFYQEIPFSIQLEKADLHQVLGPLHKAVFPLKLKTTGVISGIAKLMKKSKQAALDFEIKSVNNINVTDFSFDNQSAEVQKPLRVLIAADSLNLKSETTINSKGIFIHKGTLQIQNTKFDVSGSVTGEKGFDLDLNGDVDLSEIHKLAAFEIEGKGKLHWSVKTKGKSNLFTFDADLENSRYLDLFLGRASGRVIFDDDSGVLTFENLSSIQGKLECVANGTINLSDTDDVNIDVEVPNGTIQDFARVFALFIKKAVPWYPYELTGQLSGKIKVSGKTDMDKLSVLGDIDLANVDYHYEIFRSAHMRAGYVRGDYVAENASIQKKNGWFKGNFKFDRDNVITYDVHSDALSTLDIDRFGLLDIPYRAGITFHSKGSGKLNSLKSSTLLQIGSGSVKNYFIPSSELILNTENNRVKAKASIFNQQADVNLDYGWSDGSLSNIEIEARSFDFLPALVVINPNILDESKIESRFSGKAKLFFRTGEFSMLNGTADITDLILNRTDNTMKLSNSFHLDIRNGDYQFARARVVGDLTDFTWSGLSEHTRLSHDINGQINLRTLELLVPEFHRFDGVAQFQSQIRGTTSQAKFNSAIEVKNAEVKVRSLVQPFENVNIKINVNDDVATFTEMSSRFATGKISGIGKVVLYTTKVPDVDFQFNFSNPKIQTYPVVFARVNGKLTLTGSELPYLAKGSFNVVEALVRENFNNNDGTKMLRTTKFMPQGKTVGSSDFQLFEMDIDLYADQGIIVKNDLFDGEVKGKLKLIKTPKTPGVLGNVSIINGKLLFKDSYFAIQSGSLRFSNPALIDPEFEISGQTDYKGYKIFLVSNGKTSDYKISFQSQPQLSQNDIVNLLTLGVTSSGAESLSGLDRETYTRDEMVGLIFNQSSFNKGLQEKLGVKLKLSQSQSATPESLFRSYPNDTSSTISPKVVIQKQVTKNLNASAGSTVGVGENKEQSFDLEYNVGRNWSVLGVYEDQRGAQPQNSRTSVGADLKFKLRFK